MIHINHQKRDKLDIMAAILEACQERMHKTKIVYSCNLNFKITEPYLEFLITRGFIEQSGVIYKLTEKGLVLLEKIRELKKMLE
ncbi:Winged helix-turn-helix [uncultured archaeon]|nr:Winged helix-turn-helix [uncultured archaeon]